MTLSKSINYHRYNISVTYKSVSFIIPMCKKSFTENENKKEIRKKELKFPGHKMRKENYVYLTLT